MLVTAAGCVSMPAPGPLTRAIVPGTVFRHDIAFEDGRQDAVLRVFIEGDGTPWDADGQPPAANPTPRYPLALALARATPPPVLYLGRPCYFRVAMDPGCAPPLWTAGRYSESVVDSMTAALTAFISAHGYRRATLIGYSGGGTLAVLIAPRVPATVAVITVAANLDTDGWTRLHGYLPLTGSLNPATESPLPEGIVQLNLLGGRDTNVPERASQRYLQRLRDDQVWRYPGFDHRCCWEREWPSILKRIGAIPAI